MKLADKHVFEAFKKGNYLEDYANVKVGLQTGDNNRFLRYWFEVNVNTVGFKIGSCDESINSNLKWFPYNKGGYFRKWYGNHEYIINWANDGLEIRNFHKSVIRNSNFYFHESLGWSSLSSGNIGFRYYPKGFLFDTKGSSVFVDKDNFSFIFAFLNSNVCQSILNILAPTIDYSVGSVSNLPLIFEYVEFENKIRSFLRKI